MVFEIYGPGIGLELGGGGRYDSLLGRFGLPWPAVGFSLSLDRLAQRVDDRIADLAKEPPVTSVQLKKERSRGLAEALRLRKQGVKVRID